MSFEDIHALHKRIFALKFYILNIPKSVQKAKSFDVTNLHQLIDDACSEFPNGDPYDRIISDINNRLPTTITDKLAELHTATTNCANLCEPYRGHILSEAAGISAELQTFRAHHLTNTSQLFTVGLLLQQLHSLQ
jgi:hypothetical protein